MAGPADAGVRGSIRRKLTSLGFHGDYELRCLQDGGGLRRSIPLGKDIVGAGETPTHVTVLLAGVACLYQMLESGERQIYAFYYSSDFCALHTYVAPERDLAVGALTDCSVGSIPYKDLDEAIKRHPELAIAWWRVAMLEARSIRERLLNVSRRCALERVAHLLCEQLHRRKAIGIDSQVIPLTQIELADAAGLSAVHVNRIVQELRNLGALSRKCRVIEVANPERLQEVANFETKYLTAPEMLTRWEVQTGSE